MENKVRNICNEVFEKTQTTLDKHTTDIKKFMESQEQTNLRIKQVNALVERELKLKD